MHVALLRPRDDLLDQRPDFLGPGLGRLDALVHEHRACEAVQYRTGVARVGTERATLLGMSHVRCLLGLEPQAHLLKLVFHFFDGLGAEVTDVEKLSLIHISEPTRLGMISYAVF